MFTSFQKIFSIVSFALLSNAMFAATVIPFELINGLIVIEAEINGESGNFIVDSGANGILLNGKAVSSNTSYQTLDGVLEGSETKIKSLKVGDYSSSRLLGFTVDLSSLEVYLNKKLSGVIGCSVFVPRAMEFDFLNSKLTLYDNVDSSINNNMNVLHYKIVQELPIAELRIKGKKFNFILDSGASSHFIDTNVVKDLKGIFTGVSKNIITASSSDKTSNEYSISEVELGEDRSLIKAFSKDFEMLSHELNLPIAGLLSLSKLADVKIYFDIKEQKLFY